ncbi:MAG: cohesin domain-containing protein [Pirellulales bacterium]|nr:cohesin domain-containing protein [Thermoguttaceae bacterium]MDD4788812.1 cohesin domain-containing protein [Pirellulales bacterium]MDI9446731.1 cohesin domain-containing protein [Planctomycetota bacterium]NLZ03513.1 fibronectin-binding protein [Pirellulaceae bacterium]
MSVCRRRLAFESLECRSLLSAVPLSAGEAVHVHVPDDLTGQAGGQVVVPVEIDTAEGVRGAEIHLRYDSDLLQADEAAVAAGSVWLQADAHVVANVDDSAGTIVVFVYAAEGLQPASGSLLEIQFAVRGSPPGGSSTPLDLVKVRLNEGAIALDAEPAAGADPTDGQITFVTPGQTAGISGVVYADTNSNNRPDAHEGVPGVKVVLVDAGGGQSREAVTGDGGRYEFFDLAPGSYRVVEQHPEAFLDGGPNEILVDLAEGQELAGQDFRERGLRPEYVYNRLLATTVQPVGSTAWVNAVRQIVDDGGSAVQEAEAFSTASIAATSIPAADRAAAEDAAQAAAPVAATIATPARADSGAGEIEQGGSELAATVSFVALDIEPHRETVVATAGPLTAGRAAWLADSASQALGQVAAPTEIADGEDAADDLRLLAANCLAGRPSSQRHEAIDLAVETSPLWMLEY